MSFRSHPPRTAESEAPADVSRAHEAPLDTRGILNPAAQGQRFQLARLDPAPDVAGIVERYWSVRWDLAPGDSYLTETLPFPCVNLVFEADGARINGIFTRRWSRSLVGAGRVFGVKFRPGAFTPFFSRPLRELANQVLPIERVFGMEGDALWHEVLGETEDAARAQRFEAFLRPRLPAADAERERAADIVALAQATPQLRRVEELARAAQLTTRGLQRLFQRYLGVSPKWLLCRFRIQEAAERVAAGDVIDWAGLAQELGYFDQAHLASDFKAQLGKTPSEYAALAQSGPR